MPDDGNGAAGAPENGDDGPTLAELMSSGESCPMCEALDGMCFVQDPTPIHDLCDCEVELGEKSTSYSRPDEERECGDNEWELDFKQSAYPAYGRIGLVTSWWDLIVHCWDGKTVSMEVIVHHEPGTDPDIIEDEAWSELYDEAEDLAATECRKCDPPRIS